MQQPLRYASADCDDSLVAQPSARRTKILAAGVAVASAGALALTPVIVTPSLPDVQVSQAAVGLSAAEDPFTAWQQVFTNSAALLDQLGTTSSAASSQLSETLNQPAVQSQFAAMFSSLANPQRLLSALASFQTDYGDRLDAASAGSSATVQAALDGLPTVLQNTAGYLEDLEFLQAWSEVNLWLLVDVLGDGRGELLDAFRVPGDFLDSVGLEPLARILGTSWMATPNSSGQLVGPGLLSRTVLGNFARAVMAPQVTTIVQIAEILDATREALVDGDFETAANELMSAPARITNAFLNGYVPKFIEDGELLPGLPPQRFPGLFSENGTFDFFLRQVPQEISAALNAPRPPAPTALVLEEKTSPAPTDVSLGTDFVTLTVDDDTAQPSPVPAIQSAGSTESPKELAEAVSAVADDEDGAADDADTSGSTDTVTTDTLTTDALTTDALTTDALTDTADADDADADEATGSKLTNSELRSKLRNSGSTDTTSGTSTSSGSDSSSRTSNKGTSSGSDAGDNTSSGSDANESDSSDSGSTGGDSSGGDSSGGDSSGGDSSGGDSSGGDD